MDNTKVKKICEKMVQKTDKTQQSNTRDKIKIPNKAKEWNTVPAEV